jgi:hypothetical protein
MKTTSSLRVIFYTKMGGGDCPVKWKLITSRFPPVGSLACFIKVIYHFNLRTWHNLEIGNVLKESYVIFGSWGFLCFFGSWGFL